MERRLSGPRARYRGKVRRPVVVTFTPEAHTGIAEGTQREGLSRSDYLEMLVRKDMARYRRSASDTPVESGGNQLG